MKKQTTYRLTGAQLKARTAQPQTSFRSQLIAAAVVLPLATAAAVVTWFDAPTPATATTADWRTKVSQATPAELVQPAPKAAAAPKAAPAPKAQEVAQSDPLGDWAVRAHDAEQAHQDRCWDQLETRGYGDPSCY